jgi:hypothetical protein
VPTELDETSICIEPLSKEHGRGAFSCGFTPIDNFVRNNARKDHDLYKVRVFVARHKDSFDVIGLYSLTLTAVDPDSVSAAAQRKFARIKAMPAIYLALIAVCTDFRKTVLSSILFRDAFNRALDISENAGAFAITLDAVHEKVARKYEEFGFERFTKGELKMFLPLKVLRDARSEAAATEHQNAGDGRTKIDSPLVDMTQ